MDSFAKIHTAMTPEQRAAPVSFGQHMDALAQMLAMNKRLKAERDAIHARLDAIEAKAGKGSGKRNGR